MKKALLLICVACLPYLSFSQVETEPPWCTVTGDELERQGEAILRDRVLFRNDRPPLQPGEIGYIPVKIHWVRNTDGSFSNNDSPRDFLVTLQKANEIMSPSGIQLVVDGEIDYIDNSDYLLTIRNTPLFREMFQYKTPGVANIFIVDGWPGSGAAGYGGTGGTMELASTDINTVVHELGHLLSLPHTFDTPGGRIETVTRDLANGGNCDEAGDKICDTPADPYGLKPGQYTGEEPQKDGCTLVSNTLDLNGDRYSPPYGNYMSYYGGDCGRTFTPQQYARMREAYDKYYSHYRVLSEGLATAPAGVETREENGIARVMWDDAPEGTQVQVEYSHDQGLTWDVMATHQGGTGEAFLSGLQEGAEVSLRLRHLNSYSYSEVLSYTPSFPVYCLPHITTSRKEGAGIGPFTVYNTSLDKQANALEHYALFEMDEDVELLAGGTYSFKLNNILLQGDNGGYYGYTSHFKIWLDENGDGDFEDEGEVKYISPNRPFSVDTSFTLSPDAVAGPTRMRLRNFTNREFVQTAGSCDFYIDAETEDYLVIIVEDTPISLDTAYFDPNLENVVLRWSDETTKYGFVVERSEEGKEFEEIARVDPGSPLTYVDESILPFVSYTYRVRKENSNNFSNSEEVVTGEKFVEYCTPQSSNPCQVGVYIKDFAIPFIGFVRQRVGQCDTQTGFTDYRRTDTIRLEAGQTYDFYMANANTGNFPQALILADLNKDGIFSADEELFRGAGSTEQGRTNGTLTIPADTESGFTAIRIRGYYNHIPDGCGGSAYGETIDYTLEIRGGADLEGTPTILEEAFFSPTTQTVELRWSDVTTAYGFSVERSANGLDFEQIAIVDPGMPLAYSDADILPNRQYTYRVRMLIGFAYSNEKSVVIGPKEIGYCFPESIRPCNANFFVREFTVPDAGFTYSSNACNSEDGYTDHTEEHTLQVQAGGEYDFTLLNRNNQGYFNHALIAADLNQDGTFSEDEWLYRVSGQNTGSNNAGTLSIPEDAKTGITRMRVRTYFNGIRDACLPSGDGATIDISLEVTGGLPAAVTNFRARGVSDEVIDLNWSVPESAQRPGNSLLLAGSEDGTNFSPVTVLESDVEFYRVGGLEPGTRYFFKLIVQGEKVSESRLAWANTLPEVLIPLEATLNSEVGPYTTGPFSVVVSWNQPVADFGVEDLELVNAQVTGFSGSQTEFSFQVTPLDPGLVSVRVAPGAEVNGIVKEEDGSNTISTLFDPIPPVLSFRPLSGSVFNVMPRIQIEASETVNLKLKDIQVNNARLNKLTFDEGLYTLTLTPVNEGEVSISLPAGITEDPAGNPNEGTASLSFVYDVTDPLLRIFSTSGAVVAGPFDIFISATERITGLEESDIEVSNGFLIDFDNSADTARATVIPESSGMISVDIAAGSVMDLAGNPNPEAATLVRNLKTLTGPQIILSSSAPDTVNAPFRVRAELTEPTRNFRAVDVEVINGDISNFDGSSDTEFSWEVRPDGYGPVEVRVEAGVFTNVLGDPNYPSNVLERFFDNQRPEVILRFTDINGELFVEMDVSEPNLGFTEEDLIVRHGTLTAFSSLDEDFFFNVLPDEEGRAYFWVPPNVFTDRAGNLNEHSNRIEYEGETIPPEVVITRVGPDLVNGPFEVNITLSEEVLNFTEEDIRVENGVVIALEGGYTEFVATIDPLLDGLLTVQVPAGAIEDLNNNLNLASNIYSLVYDSTSPSLSLTSTSPDTLLGDFEVILTTSEELREVNANDFLVSNATVTAIEQLDPTRFRVSLSPMDYGTIVVTLRPGAFTDLAGNTVPFQPVLVRFNDNASPMVVLTSPDRDTLNNDITVYIELSEPVSTFSGDMLSTNNGFVQYFVEITPGKRYYAILTGFQDGPVDIQVEGGAFTDPVGNPNHPSNVLHKYIYVALPVQLVSFDAKVKKAKHVELVWKTATEINNDFFDIDRSMDGIDWETLGSVPGAGTTDEPRQYTFLDETPEAGLVNYYRLRQVDHDGRESFSDVISVKVGEVPEFEMRMYPNPVRHQVFIDLQGEPIRTVRMLDAAGRELSTQINFMDLQHAEIDVSGLPSGVYFIQVNGETRRLIKD